MKIFEPLIKELQDTLKEFKIIEEIDFKISNIDNFDYQINNLVKYQKNKEIKNNIKKFEKVLINNKVIKDYEITKNYFINIRINLDNCEKFLLNIRKDIKNKNSKNILIDYGGPNIGKPLHVGHLRSLNIGRSIKELNKIVGNKVTTDIHLGDWGMPVAQIIAFCESKDINIKSITADKLIEIYPSSSELYTNSEKFAKLAKEKNKKLNELDKETIENWKHIREASIKSMKEILDTLNHEFDLWLGESSVNELIEPMLKSLKKEGKVDFDDGALVSTQNTDPKILITKSDGSYLYLTTDIATVLNRLEKNDFDTTLYVVDARQKLHFIQLFETIKYFDFPEREYKHIDFGTINDDKGKPFRTREGGTKKLKTLYNETFDYIKNINKNLETSIIHKLTNTVLTYSDLLTNRKTDYKFDLKKFTNMSGKTGIYVQYAQVRAKNIIKKSKNKFKNNKLTVVSEAERNLTIALLNLEIVINQSIKFNEPHHLANYLYEIANLFNIFYQDENILNLENQEIKNSKLLITKCFLDVTQLVFEGLGIEPVDEM
tara:strand:+ start:2794 stop:4431 length:1638 start_codon:yes stop_codon:yes gene_type:complete